MRDGRDKGSGRDGRDGRDEMGDMKERGRNHKQRAKSLSPITLCWTFFSCWNLPRELTLEPLGGGSQLLGAISTEVVYRIDDLDPQALGLPSWVVLTGGGCQHPLQGQVAFGSWGETQRELFHLLQQQEILAFY